MRPMNYRYEPICYKVVNTMLISVMVWFLFLSVNALSIMGTLSDLKSIGFMEGFLWRGEWNPCDSSVGWSIKPKYLFWEILGAISKWPELHNFTNCREVPIWHGRTLGLQMCISCVLLTRMTIIGSWSERNSTILKQRLHGLHSCTCTL